MPCGRIGTTELLLIGLLVVLLFGATRLPELGKGLGLGIRRFKKAVRDEPASDANDESENRIEQDKR